MTIPDPQHGENHFWSSHMPKFTALTAAILVLGFLSLFALHSIAQADEGMWTFDNFRPLP
jgi:hypothetical protein